MEVGIYGYEWFPGGGVSIDILNDSLAVENQEGMVFDRYQRNLFFVEKGEYWAGIFVTSKDQTKVTELFNDRGELKAEIRELPAGHKPMDFNFFVLNPQSMKGVYQHYYGAASLGVFCRFVRSNYNKLRDGKIKEAIQRGGGDGISNKAKKSIKKSFGKPFKYAQIIRKESLEQLIEQFKHITEFSFYADSYFPEEKAFTGVSKHYRSHLQRFTFSRKSKVSLIGGAVIKAVRGADLDRFSIKGIDEDNDNWTVKADIDLQVPDCFKKYDYEDIVTEENLDFANIGNAPIIKDLIAIMHSHQAVFGKAR
jgi:hypothetical protein